MTRKPTLNERIEAIEAVLASHPDFAGPLGRQLTEQMKQADERVSGEMRDWSRVRGGTVEAQALASKPSPR